MHKINKLEESFKALKLERLILEQKIEQRHEYRQAFNEIKANEIKDEIAKIEIQKVKCQARNANLL